MGSETNVTDGETDDSDDGENPRVVPKIEDVYHGPMEGILHAKRSDESENSEERSNMVAKRRGRGRPRKIQPSPTPSFSNNKATKGRSKTGCLTCRRRKKKCDEGKPGCNNCQKNGVICEGYAPREVWKGGKQRSEEFSRRLSSFSVPTSLPVLVEGVETDVDRRFLDHFVSDLSRVLTMEDCNRSNPFKDLLLPMAIAHKGLMHSLMALSGSHIVAREPLPEFNERQEYHFDAAVTTLKADIDSAIKGEREEENSLVDDPTVASTIVQCLISICKGSTNGEYRMHMNGARRMIPGRESKNPEFTKFIYEFFLYHDISNSVTSLDRRSIVIDDNDRDLPQFLLKPAVQPGAGVLVGVLDGLFKFITRITGIRDNIRARKAAGLNPTVTYESLMLAVAIDAGIRDWSPGQEENTCRWVAAQLYRQCTWVYLYRTIQASRPSDKISAAVDGGLEYLQILEPGESTQCILLLPLFILGCAAFDHNQRPPLEKAFDNLQEYSKLGNIKPARQIVHTVWERMDAGDETSWDWEGIMASLGMDLLVT